MPSYLVVVPALLALTCQPPDPPRQAPPPAAPADLKPVTVVVVDDENERPVTRFTYQASYVAPGRKSSPNDGVWRRVESPTGTFDIPAPPSCRLYIMAKAPDYVGGSPLAGVFVIRSTDKPRRVVVRLRRGITVRGTVRDSQTNNPIAGATVAPRIPGRPVRSDVDKQVTTGPDGRFELRGVEPMQSITASHPDYVDDPTHAGAARTNENRDIFLKRGVTVTVTVVDSTGKPLEGVTAGNTDLNRAVSGKDGRLVLRNFDSLVGANFSKDGFIARPLSFDEARQVLEKPDGSVVVMERSIALAGKVIAPDGRPVTAFTIAAGTGKLPARWDSVRHEVQNGDGRFNLSLSKEGTTWVGVAAEGFAPWEGWVELKRGSEPLEVRLSPGVTVSARVVPPDALRNSAKAELVIRRDMSQIGAFPFASDSLVAELPTRTAIVSHEGTLRFDHVRPDRYRLIIEDGGVIKAVLGLDVPGAGIDGGAVRLGLPAATGRIEGRVWRPKDQGGGVWEFADGYVGGFRLDPTGGGPGSVDAGTGGMVIFRGSGEPPGVAFMSDEDGRFTIGGVPVGLTTVGFPFQVYDVVDAYRWSAFVVEGQTTRVGAFDPEAHRQFTLAFVIGDGSDAQYQAGTGMGAARKVDNVTTASSQLLGMLKRGEVTPRPPRFRVELVPVSKGPLSFAKPDWADLDAQRKIVLPDVGPGTYRLRVYDWLGLIGLDSGALFDHEVVVPAGGRGEVRIPLGAGCITGKVLAANEVFGRAAEVTVVATGSRIPSRRTHCDEQGNFCVRYLSPGTYSLFITDPTKASCCRVDDVRALAGVVDVGELALSAGATVKATIHFTRPARLPDEVIAIGPLGVSVRRQFRFDASFDQSELAGLWPGHWTISARSDDEVIARCEVDVAGTGTFQVDLTTRGGQGP